MTLITSVSDPVLHAKLEALYFAQRMPGWVMIGNNHYKVVHESTANVAFVLYAQEELFDSRSTTGSKAAQYTKLDDG